MNVVDAKGFLSALVLTLLLAPGASQSADAGPPLSETQARDLLTRRLQEDALYGASIGPECLNVHTERRGPRNFDFIVRPKPEEQCVQARGPATGVDEFRVLRATGQLLWWNDQEDIFVEYERAKNHRKQ